MFEKVYEECRLCPRECGVNRKEGRKDRVLSDGWDTAGGKSGPTYVGGTMHFRKKGFGRRIFFGM